MFNRLVFLVYPTR